MERIVQMCHQLTALVATIPKTLFFVALPGIFASYILYRSYCYKIKSYIIVWFRVGGPGAGKGTQSANLNKKYSEIKNISPGAVLRQFIKTSNSKRAKQACICI